jgi:hypothetical protein
MEREPHNEGERKENRTQNGEAASNQANSNSDANRAKEKKERGVLLKSAGRYLLRYTEPANVIGIFIAAFTLGLMIFAYRAWREAQNSTDDLVESLRLQARATLKNTNWTFDEGAFARKHTPIIGFEFDNTGHTAAYMIRGVYDYTISSSLPVSFDLNNEILPGFPAIISQGATLPFRLTTLPPIVDSISGEIESGTMFIFLRVIARFRDLVGTTYEIKTTGQWGPHVGFIFPEAPDSATDLSDSSNCGLAAHRRFNTYRRIPCGPYKD